ncbi:MAG: gliding motility-associated C-terminal domain-containing protein [Bacteroidales bacterium]|nr:gliding motility-associated C-terminal domain-containing protein [Bacteroidales bacterium]
MRRNCSVGFGGSLGFFLVMIFALVLNGFSQNENSLHIDSVSVLPGTNHVIIGWTLQTTVTEGYIEIHRQLPNETYDEIANIPNVFTSSFIDNGVNAGSAAQSYYLTSKTLIDTLFSSAHRTIFLRDPNADFCEGEVSLSWTNYQVETTTGQSVQQLVPFDSLRIQVSNDGQVFSTIETLPQPQPPQNLQIQEFSVSGLNPSQYFFRIQAYNSETGVTSSSNIKSYGYNPPELSSLQVDYVDIVENQELQIAFSASGDTGDFSYEILRSDNPDTGFDPVDTATAPEVVSDAGAEVSQGPWFYRVKAWRAEGECELHAFETTEDFSSIFLSATARSAPNEIMISWQHHFPAVVDFEYTLKLKSEQGLWVEVPNFINDGSGEFFHRFIPGELVGIVTYKLEAYRRDNPTVTISSNYVAVQIEPLVHIPNAFRPTSQHAENRTFKPFFVGFTPESYQLRVFNRWGLVIFTSDDPLNGWDGNMNGSTATPGVYSYLIQYMVPGGKTIENRGVVTLVY